MPEDKIVKCSFCKKDKSIYGVIIFLNAEINACEECRKTYDLSFNEKTIIQQLKDYEAGKLKPIKKKEEELPDWL
jgi:hypothetical protein